MKLWIALLGVPFLALLAEGINYALVTPACHRHSLDALMGVSIVVFTCCCSATFLAWRCFYRERDKRPTDAGGLSIQTRFLPFVATLVGSFFSIVVVVMWIPQWLLPACI